MAFSTLLFIAIAVLIFTVYYAWWTKIRVLKLRQDIFDKRDHLFDVAARLDEFDDPGYRAARLHLNSMLDMAKYFSVQSVEYMVKVGHLAPVKQTVSPNKELQEAIDDTFNWLIDRIAKYLIRETFSGWLVYIIYGDEPSLKRAFREETQEKVRAILNSDVLTYWQPQVRAAII